MHRRRIWEIVHAERTALAADLAAVPGERWATPSLLPGWDVHDVVAHLVDTALTTRISFVWRMLRARGDFDRDNEVGIRAQRRETPAGTLAALQATAALTRTPPAPLATRLVEAVVHGEDVRRPLGITHHYPSDAVAAALAYQLTTAVGMGGGRERVAGLRLVVDGEGGPSDASGERDASIRRPIDDDAAAPLVTGPALELLLAVSGRPAAIHGPGAARLLAR
ncbi:maleylpyruvate isomerase family mycothiol-dependent enzyme [Salana multivorans]